ncbi:MAG: carboxylesterase family protein, partial [Microbacterium sp.]|nr:carboxylesterase family protein [Microbacterium sp.]
MAPVSDTQASATRATISSGTLEGVVADGIRRFLGIPYAEPPFGPRRFGLPVAVAPWTGVRDASAFGPTAPQDPYRGAMGELLGSIEIPGEDILTVNVWAPTAIPDAGLPVMIWYHGGALERGTAALSIYDGSTFARDGVVFVSVGYRLGAEGFSVLEGAPLNLGLADAAAAFQWVRREVGAFGGDAE